MAPKKKETVKMSLGSFMTDEKLGSWADEMEDMPVNSRASYGGERKTYGQTNTSSYGGSGALAGYSVREELPLPDKPPYTTHLGNLSFDATKEDVQDFFADCDCINVRIIEDKMEMKPKGFGYAEFGSRDGLIKALALSGSQFQGRNIRVSVADPPKQSEAREITDWSRKGPLPDLPGRGGNDRGADRGYNSGGRFEGAEGGRERREFNQDDGRVRDFGNWERKGPLAAPVREGGRTSTQGPRGDSFNDRRASPAAWGEGRPQGSQDGGSRPPRREFQERPVHERAPTAAEQDSKWRQKMRPDAPIASPSEEASQAAPAGRPKLNLAKRTTSAAVDAPATSVDAPATSGDAKASPFGAARPIDTAAKEREIEDKRLAALEAKKKVDEKAKEDEKEAKEAEAAAAAVAEVAQKVDGLEIVDKDAAAAKPVEATRPSESAWRKPAAAVPKPTQTDARDAPRPRRDGPARGPRNDNRAPRENRGPRVNGGPQNDASAAVAAPQAASTPAVEAEPSPATEDGWSTVQKPKKISRGSYRN